MHNNRSYIYVQTALVAALTLLTGEAMAQQSLGDVVLNTADSFYNFPSLFSMVAYLSGLVLGANGIFKLKHHVEGGPGAPALSDPVKRFLGAGSFLSAPYLADIAYGSTFGEAGQLTFSSAAIGSGNVSGNGLDAMLVRLMTDIGGPIEFILLQFCYIFAIGFLLVGISRLTKRAEDGPRGPAGMGTIMTFVTAGALFAFGDTMGSFSTSLFGDANVATRVTLADTMGLTGDDKQRLQTVIESVMAFVMIVGFIAFIRGWFVLRAFADGAQGATMAQGLTFLFGGALAINLGELVNAVQETVGVSGLTFS